MERKKEKERRKEIKKDVRTERRKTTIKNNRSVRKITLYCMI